VVLLTYLHMYQKYLNELKYQKYLSITSQIENLLKTAKEKAGVLRSLQGTLREIKQLKKSKRDEAEAEIEKTCDVFINAIYRVSALSIFYFHDYVLCTRLFSNQ